MARLINTKTNQKLYVTLKTIFVDGTETERKFTVGDVVENLRYAYNGEIVTVSGKVTAINYTMNSKLTWNAKKPDDTLATDLVLKNIVIDTSEQYSASSVTIPCEEILEDEGIENVKMIQYIPMIKFEMEMFYSNRSSSNVSIEIGDSFDNVRIINANKVGYDNDYTGSFKVIGMGYKILSGKVSITSIAFQNTETEEVVVADIDKILQLTEVFNYSTATIDDLLEAISGAGNGDTITISDNISTVENAITFDGVSLDLDLNGKQIETDSSNASVLTVKNGTVTIDDATGTGGIVTTTPYDATHSTNVLRVGEGGKVVINNMTVEAVVGTNQESVDKGQYGIGVLDNGELVVNNGNFHTGWFCVNTHGVNTNTDAKITLNGGKYVSASDYVLYMAANTYTEVNDGEYTGGAGVLSMNNGRCRINGGTFYVTDEGNTGVGKDGTTGQANALFNINAKYGDCKLGIYDGKFTVGGSAPLFKTGTAHNAEIRIYGGQFSVRPDDQYMAEGYACSTTVDDEGFFFVYNTNGLNAPLGEWP